ncbi:hypothetical protein R3P38DRAFT_3607734 [Favolaschia claudopus]|uniref:Uncharacterized protein n=1 Tax=Favolaschia claudopus TaxID=2862362 RepID=A0AAW0DCE7_9AGAR
MTDTENPRGISLFGRNLPDCVQTGPYSLDDELADIAHKLGIVGSVVQAYEKELESVEASCDAAEADVETARRRIVYFDQLKKEKDAKDFKAAQPYLAAAESALETAHRRVLNLEQLKKDAKKKMSDARLQAAVLRLEKREAKKAKAGISDSEEDSEKDELRREQWMKEDEQSVKKLSSFDESCGVGLEVFITKLLSMVLGFRGGFEAV